MLCPYCLCLSYRRPLGALIFYARTRQVCKLASSGTTYVSYATSWSINTTTYIPRVLQLNLLRQNLGAVYLTLLPILSPPPLFTPNLTTAVILSVAQKNSNYQIHCVPKNVTTSSTISSTRTVHLQKNGTLITKTTLTGVFISPPRLLTAATLPW